MSVSTATSRRSRNPLVCLSEADERDIEAQFSVGAHWANVAKAKQRSPVVSRYALAEYQQKEVPHHFKETPIELTEEDGPASATVPPSTDGPTLSVTPERILEVVCEVYEVDQVGIQMGGRKQEYTKARSAFCYVAHCRANILITKIKPYVGARSYATIYAACNRMKSLIRLGSPDVLKVYEVLQRLRSDQS